MGVKRWVFGFIVWATTAAQAEETLVRIDLRTFSQAAKRMGAETEIVAVDRIGGFVDVIVDQRQQQLLRQSGISTKTVIKDINAYADSLRQSGYLDHFHSPQRILDELERAAADYRHITMLHDIGDGYLKQAGLGGQDIWAMKISDEPQLEDSSEADVLFIGNIHAREIITTEIILYFMFYLLENYGKDPWVTHLVNNREIWVIPTMNPEGLNYVFSGYPEKREVEERRNPLWWRKNMRDNNRDGEFSPYTDGVDLNRNWGWQWGIDDRGSSPVFGDPTYRGIAPFSEPETQALRNFVKQHRFVISLCYHSYSNLWLYPWGYTADPLPEPALSIFKELADSCTVFNGYRPQSASQLYLVNGDSDDWLWGECGIYAFSPEVGHPDFDGFFPDTSRILPLVSENLHANLFVAYAAGEEPRISYEKLSDVYEKQNMRVCATLRPPITLTEPVEFDSTSVFFCYRYAEEETFQSVPLRYQQSSGAFCTEIFFSRPGKIYCYVEAMDKRGRRGAQPQVAPLALDSLQVRSITNVADISNEKVFAVFPNPFNSETVISFVNDATEDVILRILDLRGRTICILQNGFLEEGVHLFRWNGELTDGKPAASGIYYALLKIGTYRFAKKLVLLR